MVVSRPGTLDDTRLQLALSDMSGGLVTDVGPLAMSATQTPDSLNVFAWNGQLRFRGGYTLWCTLPGSADGDFAFLDAAGIQHMMVWCIGNLYDVVTGSAVLVSSAVYVAGQTIAHCQLNSKMYWATPTVPLRQYDGITEEAVPYSNFQQVIITDPTTAQQAAFEITPATTSLTISPATAVATVATTFTLTGVGTNWTSGTPGTPAFTISGGSISSQTITSATSATINTTMPMGAQIIQVTDPSTNAQANISVTTNIAITLGVSPTNVVQSQSAIIITLTGAGTTWVTTEPTFTASIGTISDQIIVTNTQAILTYVCPPTSALLVQPPACRFLIPFNGSLVAVDPAPNGVPQNGAFMWSDVNDPTTWFGNSIQEVGSNDGAQCTFALLMGISQVGVEPAKSFMVGKTKTNIFIYQGALGQLTEQAISCPVGALTAPSAVYIPTQEGLGAVQFLGSDAQVWLSNGVEAYISSKNIKTLVYQLVQNALQINKAQQFNSTYNDEFQYSIIDFGNSTQLVYKWDTGAWWYFAGWPSGPYMTAPGSAGLPTVFVASNTVGTTGVYELGLEGNNDNGSAISAYYMTPYIHGGKPERQKEFDVFTLFAFNVGVQYTVTPYAMPRGDNQTIQGQAMILNDGAYNPTTPYGAFVWGTGVWGSAIWGGGYSSIAQPYETVPMRSRISYLSTGTKWVPPGIPFPMRSGACQFKIAYSGGANDFRVVRANIGYSERATTFVGNLPYGSQGNFVQSVPDKYTNIPSNP
jgi:hypothetical protein